MKKLSLFTVLSLTTILSACGGGGGGHSDNVPVTALPTTVTNNETSMVSANYSNSQRRIELYQKATSSTGLSGSSIKTMSEGVSGFATVDSAYKTMYDLLVSGKTPANSGDLQKSLLLAGFDADDLPDTGLDQWFAKNALMIKAKAQKIWDMYGVEKDVNLQNANLTAVDSKSTKQDSYISFKVDDKGKITGLIYDIETKSSGSRQMEFERKAEGKFVRENQGLYTIQFPMTGYNHSLELELLEDVNANNIGVLKQKLLAKLYETQERRSDISEEVIANTEATIKNLTFAQFQEMKNNQKEDEFYAGNNTSIEIKYKSYAKKLPGGGLKYSDFGVFEAAGDNAFGGDIVDKSVIAGGYDVKRIDPKKFADNKFTFEGDAIATVLWQKEKDNVALRDEKADMYEGDAKLEFDHGKETLSAEFKKWYDVKVTSNNKDNYDISFTNGNRVSDDQFKFIDTKEDGSHSRQNFVGNYQIDGRGEYYGSIDIGYYGNNGTPEEATGYVTYGEEFPDGVSGSDGLHVQIGFGTKVK